MKQLITILFICLLLSVGCNRASNLSLFDSNKNEIIAFQPLDDFNVEEIRAITQEIGIFFNRKVIILNSIAIPATYFDPVVKMYSADSIVMQLSGLRSGDVVEVIGLTHKPLYTIEDSRAMPHYKEGILGFGHQPGNACVVSDNNIRIRSFLTLQRLRNNILHEIGHNMGLDHCPAPKCAMLKRNSGDDYCERCRDNLKK